ncbi:MAG: ABC transporter permease subunit [Bacteroidales bacterium]|nr:ABC transporter permease subunit [Bacteroidales bacterium]
MKILVILLRGLLIVGAMLIVFIVFMPFLGLFMETSKHALTETMYDLNFYLSLLRSISLSLLSVLVFGFFLLPLSYVISCKKFPLKGFIWALFQIPAFIPHIAAGIALFGVFSAQGMLGQRLTEVGSFIVGTPAGIMLSMAFVSLPYFFNTMVAAFSSVPKEMEWIALNAGANQVEFFFKILLPSLKKQIISAGISMFSRGASEFGAVLIIAYYPKTFPVYLYDTFLVKGLSHALASTGLVVLLLLILFWWIYYTSHRK